MDIRLLGPVADDEAFQALLAEESLSVGQRLDHGRYETFKRQLIALGQERGYMLGALETALVCLPETTSNLTTAWSLSALLSAGA